MNYVSVTGNNNILASTDPPYFGLITWITVQTLSTRVTVCCNAQQDVRRHSWGKLLTLHLYINLHWVQQCQLHHTIGHSRAFGTVHVHCLGDSKVAVKQPTTLPSFTSSTQVGS